jgi:hypothetical protein
VLLEKLEFVWGLSSGEERVEGVVEESILDVDEKGGDPA